MPDGTIDGGDPLRPASPRLRSPRDGGDPLRPASPRLRSPRDGGDPLRPASPRLRSPRDGGDPLRPASPRLRSPRDGGDPLRPASPRLRSPHLRLATWNVNSIRTRLDRVTDWLARADVDVLAMQETKCSDSQFPTLPLFELGYEVAHVGFNQWNGVAIASRVGLDDVQVGFDGQPTWSSKPEVAATAEARALGATCGGVRVWSLYVPNGRTLDDPHYAYKLDWLAALRDTATGWLRDDPAASIALGGDWNIAPTDEDVWSPEFFVGSTHVSEPERKAFNAIVDAQFTDVVRPFTPGPDVYTYWDYTQLRFPKRQGMRIDFILASPALAARVTDAQIVREERKGKAPSDHAPVLVDVRSE